MTAQALSQALTQGRRFPLSFPVREQRRPFLEALEHIEYGRMNIIAPEGNTLSFAGPQHGPSAQLRLYDWEVLDDLVMRGEMGFAEAYIDGRCDSADLPALLTFALVNSPSLERFFHGHPWYALWLRFRNSLLHNSLSGSKRNIMAHYDLGNDFYKLWLDKGMTYSCGLFEGDLTRTLEAAQTAKYSRILRKIAASPDDHVLDIGCGWGGFAEAAAQFGLRVTAITVSEKQAQYARERIYRSGMASRVSVELADYREVTGKFDHVVSIGMFEHVGERYWPTYFDTIKKRLKTDGRAVVQTITLDDHLFEELHNYAGFLEQVIFPGGMLPSRMRFHEAAEKAGLTCREMYNFGQDYVCTLRHWLSRFEATKDRTTLLGYDETFLRLWRFYLSVCIASFAARRTDVMQVAMTHV
jgi:cyclopropane-fatty-acyl-phospholipid synthase